MAELSSLVVFCTVPDEDVGGKIAWALVGEKYAACVNIVPGIRSIYQWEGKIEDDAELLLVIKTTEDRFEDVQDLISEMHPYDVPEIIALPIQAGSAPYLAWLMQETRKTE